MPDADEGGGQQAEIYTYESASLVYGMNWSVRPGKPFRLAVGSFKEDTHNYVEIIQLDEGSGRLLANPVHTFQHAYPPTKIMFIPDRTATRPDLLATGGDQLRIWNITDSAVVLDRLLSHNKQSEYCAPLTSFDWNDVDPKRLGTCSIDTTCTIWDIERGAVDTQLIAHDREVFDIAWGGVGVFATVSADGSVRVFDLRDKEHSTIIFEGPSDTPLLRLGWNKQDPRYIATLLADSPKVIILDIRYPSVPMTQLSRHHSGVNALAWAPHSARHLCTAGDDAQALIWDLSPLSQQAAPDTAAASAAAAGGPSSSGAAAAATAAASSMTLDPMLAYTAGAEINQLQWSIAQPDWLAVSFANKTQILRV